MGTMSKGEQFASLLREARAAAGVTQTELMIDLGLRQVASISRYENGRSIPDPEVFHRIVAVLGLDPDDAWTLWGLAYAERTRAALEALGD